ncbi:hypothetical protein [Aquimarina sp. MMG016]|uniref:hypothetical protein n=1 Tax=Aquimarina sp. MMG016 TaxID=2822690 RepID=UPI001B3A0616|nr:hypothetical protein [Aquimarina sp. MMG016]MBQ4819635.1 hypothetical protein [Aquimarina sp. MMG016]
MQAIFLDFKNRQKESSFNSSPGVSSFACPLVTLFFPVLYSLHFALMMVLI